MKRLALWFVVACGTIVMVVCGYFGLLDWAALQRAFINWERLAKNGGSQRALEIAATYQDIFRTNLFADGVWFLLGAILAAIGIHGLCLLPSKTSRKSEQN